MADVVFFLVSLVAGVVGGFLVIWALGTFVEMAEDVRAVRRHLERKGGD